MTDVVGGVAPPEHTGAAAGMFETAGELGVALGVAVMGSISVFAYRTTVQNDPAALDPTTRAAVAESVTTARKVADQSPDPCRVLDTMGNAFQSGLSWSAAAVAMGLCGALALTLLRKAGMPADQAGNG